MRVRSIDKKIHRLENEKLKLQEDKKELVDNATSLYSELLQLQHDYLWWEQRIESWGIYTLIVVFFGMLIIPPFIGMYLYSQLPPIWERDIIDHSISVITNTLIISFGLLSFVVILFLIAKKYAKNRVKEIHIQYTDTSAKYTDIQSQISQKEAQISEISYAIDELRKEKEAERERLFELRQKKRGLVKFVDRRGNVRWGTPRQVKLWKIMDMDMKNRFRRLKPREFEELIRKLFVKMGYKTSLTPYTADFGADIIAKKGKNTIVIQVKKYNSKNKVGSPDVQRLLGSIFKYKANKAIFITTSDFTEEAREQARNAPIELWNHAMLTKKIEQYLLNF